MPDLNFPHTAPAPIFAALGDDTRLELIIRLSDGEPHSIHQLTDGLKLTRQGITKHLRILNDAGIVASDRVGRETRFILTPAPLLEVQAYLAQVSAQWDRALARLRTFVEE